MAKQQQKTTPPEDGSLAQEQMIQAVLRRFPAKPVPESIEVPKYPARPRDEETEVLQKEDYLRLCGILAPRVDGIHGIGPDSSYRWQNDHLGRSELQRKIRKLLMTPGHYTTEELKDWTITQILPVLATGRKLADEALRAQQKAELQEALDLCLQHKDFVQGQVRKAVAIVRQYHEARTRGHAPERAPFPEMLDEDLADFRQRDVDDLPWACFVLGLKLEGVFNVKGLFIPVDLYKEANGLEGYIFPNVHYHARGRMAPDELNDLWLIVRATLSVKKGLGIPSDCITFGMAIKDYHVSRATLQRAIASGSLTSYRVSDSGPHRVSREEVENLYPKRS